MTLAELVGRAMSLGGEQISEQERNAILKVIWHVNRYCLDPYTDLGPMVMPAAWVWAYELRRQDQPVLSVFQLDDAIECGLPEGLYAVSWFSPVTGPDGRRMHWGWLRSFGNRTGNAIGPYGLVINVP
jgi:hypothetical protein